MNIISLCLFSYIIGSIPSAYILTKVFKGIDIREVGSRNPGTTNVVRTSGIFLGILTFILDFSKGVIPVLFAKHYFEKSYLPVAMLFSIVGHIYPIFLSFSGGKGVATFFGAVSILSLKVWIIVMFVFISSLFITHIVSISSIISVIVFWMLTFILPELKNYHYSYIFFGLTTILILYRHKSNIQRLLTKEEKKLW